MTVLACDPYLSEEQIAQRGGVKVGLDELLERSDFVSLCNLLNDETAGMLGERQFAKMKRGAFFITTARGGVHDEKALAAALASGRLGGAGIDVFDREPPLPDHPLFKFDNVLVTPHSAGITVETTAKLRRACAAQWAAIVDGKAPPRVIDRAAWPRYAERFEKLLGKRPEQLA
jgi:D-3-phosphoglycerate dehydrogenase